MARLMDLGMRQLRNMLLDMASLSQKAVASSIRAYESGSTAKEVDSWADQLKLLHQQVSDLSIELIARYQPVASDLRFIKACFEISYGFFRYGRYAHDIAEVLTVFGDISKCDHGPVIEVAEVTTKMIGMSVEAFANRDVQLAKKITEMDDFVDSKYREHIRRVVSGGSQNIKCTLSATLILRYLERIADHATYIGDSVVYIVTGKEPHS
jgi:phosphate transport system protein